MDTVSEWLKEIDGKNNFNIINIIWTKFLSQKIFYKNI